LSIEELSGIIEAILFVSGDPVFIGDIASNLEIAQLDVEHAVEHIQKKYDERKILTGKYIY